MGRLRSVLLGGAVFVAACSHPHSNPAPATSASAAVPKDATAGKSPFSVAAIDASLRDEWKKNDLAAAPKADDATFLRRLYVDLAGTVPPPDVTTKFLADTSPDKRARIADTLLASPEYAEHWMNYWDDVLMGRQTKANLVDRVEFRKWLRARFANNDSWDHVVTALVAATGENGDGGAKVKTAPMAIPLAETPEVIDTSHSAAPPDDPAINGAVNWTLKYEQTPQDFGGSASRYFLGLQIQCAQCHDHKTEAWKQDDYRRFTAAFLRARIQPIDRGKTAGQVKRVNVVDIPFFAPRFAKKPELAEIVTAKPTALDGTDLSKGKDTRKALAAWMTSKQNPYFAKAFVNRMWGHFLGRGFVDPVDDIRPSNPATTPELFNRLAADFATDFDVKRLLRTIVTTEAYQLAARRDTAASGASANPENKLWSRFHLVPLGPEELLNGVFRVTDLEHTAKSLGVRNIEQLRANVVRQYAFLFDTDEEDDEPDYSGTVSQALTLLNGALVAQGARALPGSMTAQLVNGTGTDAEKVDALAVRALARHATPEEKARWVAYVTSDTTAPRGKYDPGKATVLKPFANRNPNLSPKAAAYEDLLWSMLNSSEFTFNH